jgi:RNA polymerase sigma-70 factor (ECF subfamily)
LRTGNPEDAGETIMKMTRRTEKERELPRTLSDNVDGNFEKLVRAFQDRLYSFSLRLTGNRADAEEIVQEGLVRAYRALKSYAPPRIEALDLNPWLYRIVLNVFRTRFRKESPRPVSSSGAGAVSGRGDEAAAGLDPEEAAEAGEVRRRLAEAVAALPERYRAPLVLRYTENRGYTEIAEILNRPEGTVKANVHRAVQMLKEKFSSMNGREGK